jgi:D-amino-acid dehydrogenase
MKRHSDILVVGGGVIGVACAYYLVKAGKNVRIIEQEKTGGGASHGNCGLIFSSHLLPLCSPGTLTREIKRKIHGTSPLYVKPGLELRRWIWLFQFARKCNPGHRALAIKARERILSGSKALYENLFRTEKMGSGWQKKGILLIFKSKAGMQNYAQTNEFLKAFGKEARPYIGSDVFKLEPTLNRKIYGGWFHEFDRHVKPDVLLKAWKDVLIHKGVVIENGCRLKNLIDNNGRVIKAATTKGEYTADTYVLATGAWTPQITAQLKLKLPLEPVKGYSLSMKKPASCPDVPCYFYEKGVVFTPWQDSCRLGGIMEFSGFNFSIQARRMRHLKTVSTEYLSRPLEASDPEQWVGLRPMMVDDIPVIDRSHLQRNLVLATGHGTTGMSMAPGTGKLVAEIITGRHPHIDPSPYALNRF